MYFVITEGGCIVAQGKGLMTTFWLRGKSVTIRRQENDLQNKVNFDNETG